MCSSGRMAEDDEDATLHRCISNDVSQYEAGVEVSADATCEVETFDFDHPTSGVIRNEDPVEVDEHFYCRPHKGDALYREYLEAKAALYLNPIQCHTLSSEERCWSFNQFATEEYFELKRAAADAINFETGTCADQILGQELAKMGSTI